jgi:hypothetical protein
MIFNMSTSYFHKISFHYFEDYLMTKCQGQGSLISMNFFHVLRDLIQNKSLRKIHKNNSKYRPNIIPKINSLFFNLTKCQVMRKNPVCKQLITHWIVNSDNVTTKRNSKASNPAIPLAWKKNLQATHNPILL